jgi:hypothetical protein
VDAGEVGRDGSAAEIELDREHADELGRAGDHRRPGEPAVEIWWPAAELDLDHAHAGEPGALAIAADLVASR